jgi:hypothetical protein
MSDKQRLLLGLACAAMLVAFSSTLFPTALSDGVTDFSVGLSAGLMVGVLLAPQDRRDSKASV